MITVVVAILLLLMSAAAGAAALRLIVKRRVLTLSVLLAAAAGLLMWMNAGGTLSADLGYVFVVTSEVPDAGLREALGNIDANAPVAFVVLTPEARPGLAPTWRSASEWLGDSGIGVIMQGAPQVRPGPEWGVAVADACAQAIRARRFGWLWRKPTVIMLSDAGAVWRSLPQSGLPVGDVVARLARAGDLAMFVRPTSGGAGGGRMVLVPEQASIPAVAPPDLQSESVLVRLDDPPEDLDLNAVSVTASLEVVTRDRNGALTTGRYTLEPPPVRFTPLAEVVGRRFAWRLNLIGLTVPQDQPSVPSIGEGLHLLKVAVRAKGAAGREYRYDANVYLLARRQRIVVLSGAGVRAPRSLSSLGWLGALRGPLQFPGTFRLPDASEISREQLLLTEFLRTRGLAAQATRVSHFDVQFFPLDMLKGPDATKVRDSVSTARGVVLLEPNASELADLEAALSFADSVRNGLNVLVVGPPVMDSPPPWLHTTALRAGTSGSEPARVNREARIYVVFDNSRLMRLPLRSDGPTALAFQIRAANAMLEKLGFGPDRFLFDGKRIIGPDRSVAAPTPEPDRDRMSDAFILAPTPTYLVHDRDPQLMGEDFGTGGPVGYLLDVIPGDIPTRLAGLFGFYARSDAERITTWMAPGEFYPETHVVLFSSDLDVSIPDGRVHVAFNRAEATAASPPTTPISIDDLGAAGIAVHHIKILQKTEAYAAALPKRAPAPQPGRRTIEFKVRDNGARAVTWDLANGADPDPEAEGRRIAERILDTPTGKIARTRGGRSIDQRVNMTDTGARQDAVAPDHSVLLRRVPARIDPLRSIDANVGPTEAHDALPLVVADSFGEGQVVVLGYSPFAPDCWLRDAYKALPQPLTAKLGPTFPRRFDGWGVQRILDFVELNGAVRPAAKAELDVISAELSDDASTLHVRCVGRPSDAWPPPTLQVGAEPPIQLPVVGLDASSGRAVFRYRATTERRGPGVLRHGRSATTPVFLEMAPSRSTGVNLAEALAEVAALSGGHRLLAGHDIPRASAQSLPWAAVLGLIGAVGLVISPLVTPWSGVRQILGRRRRTMGRKSGLSVEAMLVDWGTSLGRSSSLRIAGVPGAERAFESGDRLASARASSLLAFTKFAKYMKLPRRAPLVRVRYRTHTQSAIILLDNTRSLTLPDSTPNVSKAELAKFLCGFAAGVIWMRDGVIQIRSTGRRQPEFPAMIGLASLSALELAATRLAERPHSGRSRLTVPADTADGSFVFLVTDVPSRDSRELIAFATQCATQGLRLRLLQIVDPEEYRLAGLGVLAGRWSVVDRPDAGGPALQRAYAGAATESLDAVRAAGHGGVLLSSDAPAAELLRSLAGSGVFDP